VLRLLAVGGILSLFLALLGYKLTDLDSRLDSLGVAIIEETGKAATLLLVVRNLRYRWTLNGLLFGAIVGTGFAVFESAGYAYNIGLSNAGTAGMLHNIILRGGLSVFGGHILWTAIVGAALWRVRGDRPFNFGMVKDARFLRAFIPAVVMHAAWDWDSSNMFPDWIKYVVLGLIAWALVLGYIQNGLKQVREAAQRP
jgi:RsiW-degrading membrane proteinase PrsW (M82 family)